MIIIVVVVIISIVVVVVITRLTWGSVGLVWYHTQIFRVHHFVYGEKQNLLNEAMQKYTDKKHQQVTAYECARQQVQLKSRETKDMNNRWSKVEKKIKLFPPEAFY